MYRIKVDVLVTFYNQERYVNKALFSVLSQKGEFELRVLIGDDGSTDRTIELVQNWIDAYPEKIKLFIMKRNPAKKYIAGFRASQNRLNLLKYVEADYFHFLDGDDYFCDVYKIQKQINVLESLQNRDCIACGHAMYALFQDGRFRPFGWVGRNNKKYDLKEYWKRFYCSTDTILVRKSAIALIPYNQVINIFNDNVITYLFLHGGKLFYLSNVMSVYVQTGKGVWTGEKDVIKNIRSMFMYDYCIKNDPQLSFETRVRFAGSWFYFIKNRDRIKLNVFFDFYQEACRNNYIYSKLWMNYSYLEITDLIKLFYEFVSVLFSKIMAKVQSKMQ